MLGPFVLYRQLIKRIQTMFAVNFKFKQETNNMLIIPCADYELVDMHFIKLKEHDNLFVGSTVMDVEGNEYQKLGGFTRNSTGEVYIPLEHICNIIHRQALSSDDVNESRAKQKALDFIKEKFNTTFKDIVLDCTRSEGYKVLYV